MAVKTNREYRQFSNFELRAKEEETEEESYVVRGYATTWNDPYVMFTDGDVEYKEQISPKALEGAKMDDIIFLYNHEGRVYARQKNGTLNVSIDEHGLYIEADLGKTAEARSMYEDIKAGMVDQMSWAFSVNADEYDKKTHTRTITGITRVYDVSAVSIPADPNTEISARSYFDGVIEEEHRSECERQKLLKLLELKTKL